MGCTPVLDAHRGANCRLARNRERRSGLHGGRFQPCDQPWGREHRHIAAADLRGRVGVGHVVAHHYTLMRADREYLCVAGLFVEQTANLIVSHRPDRRGAVVCQPDISAAGPHPRAASTRHRVTEVTTPAMTSSVPIARHQ